MKLPVVGSVPARATWYPKKCSEGGVVDLVGAPGRLSPGGGPGASFTPVP